METKHTKEEWLRDGDFVYALTQNGWMNGHPFMENKFWLNISGLKRNISDEEKESNAKLIAAAPDLLEALTELVEWVKNGDYESSFLNKAEEAIKKATE